MQQTGTTVTISTGSVEGQEENGLRIFRGIPFAEPPTGNLRFRPTVPAAPWDGTLPADDFGPPCPQTALGPEFLAGDFARPSNEDCLTLNVWAHDDGQQRPVMVFIYGGGFVSGDSAWPLYEATDLAINADVTVVSINYRLGVLGYLATEELAEESGIDSAGNYGLHDQIEALRWVQTNIRAFGGDPDNVTVFGESAGAISVCAILGAPSADDLFHKAIIESGIGGPVNTPSIMEGGAALMEELGCDDAFDPLRCLRTLPLEDLEGATKILSIFSGDLAELTAVSPHVDGTLIPEQPLLRLSQPGADKPLIVGSNEDEGILFAGAAVVVTRAGFERAVEDMTGATSSTAEAVVDLYSRLDYPLASDAWLAFLGELSFICPGVSAAREAAGGAPAYAYHFTRSPLLTRAIGVAHGIELFYVFSSFDEIPLVTTPPDRRVEQTMQRAWGSFAHTGTPDLAETWPAYSATSPAFAILDDPVDIVTEIRGGRCDDLRRLGLVP
ncbi:unnamed protein product [Chondrus crispus]|uniref:Carboxylic ester hydrolase n=1 Tax=Chondrus crispus TaxID=2769 RepID=R7QUT2_CHOCR|nr:unnamed protein product [Chondrus crispus]CDF41418.1 unnamed protein product [Chondrus crispus]|eukprot:XP_005711712.1 unnamed protein product [Chondrus crispus]